MPRLWVFRVRASPCLGDKLSALKGRFQRPLYVPKFNPQSLGALALPEGLPNVP